MTWEKVKKMSLAEMLKAKEIMDVHHRSDGYIAFTPDDKYEFFDSEPSFGGFPITYSKLIKMIEDERRTD